MTTEADAISSAVLEEFERLPLKRKPVVRDNGVHEWVPLSGIVAKGTLFYLQGLVEPCTDHAQQAMALSSACPWRESSTFLVAFCSSDDSRLRPTTDV